MGRKQISDSSDDEEVSKDHKKLLQAIGNITRTQHIKKPSRSEPADIQNEFSLVKPRAEKLKEVLPTTAAINILDVVKTLKGTSKHIKVGKELSNVQHTSKLLPKPLEKPEEERILRTINYEKAKNQLQRWDPIVTHFQAADTQVFPLESETVYINTGKYKKPPQLELKPEVQVAIEEAEARLRALKGEVTKGDDDQELLLLTREELKERRKEMMYIKMRQSQKCAKLRMQNKIKSKKYRKLMKQKKLKDQLKEFEILQKQNPEAALEKLQSIERNRILERASLRHKNTGTWAKNNLVKAKYNIDVQRDLSEQLNLNRQLTEKKQVSGDEDEDDNDNVNDREELIASDPFNPWMSNSKKKSQESDETPHGAGYRKYWAERNKNEKKLKAHQEEVSKVSKTASDGDSSAEQTTLKSVKSDVQKPTPLVKKTTSGKGKNSLKAKAGKTTKSIDTLFDEAEEQSVRKAKKQAVKAKKLLAKEKKSKVEKQHKKDSLKNFKDLSFKTRNKRIDIDEKLLETPAGKEPQLENSTSSLKPDNDRIEDISHDNFVEVKPKKLKMSLGDLSQAHDDESTDDEGMEFDRQAAINDAFEDDDIVADFEKEKTDKETAANADTLVLSMPGWGAWAGSGISEEASKTKKLVLQFGKNGKKSSNDRKSNVRVNDTVNKKLREHLVSDVPFPFTSVKDFEGSIRAPVGRMFVPETAFRLLTQPAVVTKKGKIIAPMDESQLMQRPKRPRNSDNMKMYNVKVEK